MFTQDKVSDFQDGASGLTEPREAYTDLPDYIHSEMGTAPLPLSPTHDPGSDSLTSSPAKARMRMDTPQPHSPHDMTSVVQMYPIFTHTVSHPYSTLLPT